MTRQFRSLRVVAADHAQAVAEVCATLAREGLEPVGEPVPRETAVVFGPGLIWWSVVMEVNHIGSSTDIDGLPRLRASV